MAKKDGNIRNPSEKDQVQKREDGLEMSPDGSKPDLDWACVALEGYFNNNLSQMTSIYRLAAIFIAAGFIIVA